MTGTDPDRRVAATPAARQAIAGLLASEGPVCSSVSGLLRRHRADVLPPGRVPARAR